MTYLTDERRLYEVVCERVDENYASQRKFSPAGSVWMRSLILRDCQSEMTFALREPHIRELRRVRTDLDALLERTPSLYTPAGVFRRLRP